MRGRDGDFGGLSSQASSARPPAWTLYTGTGSPGGFYQDGKNTAPRTCKYPSGMTRFGWQHHEAGAELAWAEVGVHTTPSGSWGGLWPPQDGGTLLGGGDWPWQADPARGCCQGLGAGCVRVGTEAGLGESACEHTGRLGRVSGSWGRRQVVLGALRPSSALPGQTSQGPAETPPVPPPACSRSTYTPPPQAPRHRKAATFPGSQLAAGTGRTQPRKLGPGPPSPLTRVPS